jgi:hypothetical protein
MLTNREILSRINQSGGGVAFADGEVYRISALVLANLISTEAKL